MNPELKAALEAMERSLAEFKAEHKRELAEVTAKGAASAETLAAVERANTAATAAQEAVQAITARLDAAETVLARGIPTGHATTREEREAENLRIANFLSRARQRPVDAILSTLTDSDVEAVRNYTPAFRALLRSGGHNGQDLPASVLAALQVGVDPSGGYLVPPDSSGRIVQLVHESSPMRQLATVESTTSDRKSGRYDLGEADAGWVGEQEARPETATPGLGEWEIPVRELYAKPKATQQVIDDTPNIEAWLEGKVADKFARMEATAFILGNHPKRPRGILTYAAGTPTASVFNKIQQINSGAAGAFAATNPGDVFHDVIGNLKAPYLANASWVLNRTTLAAVRKLKDGDGTYLWEKSFQPDQPFTLLGLPVTLAEDMPVIAANSLSIAFGDFRAAYLIVDRTGIRVLRDPYTEKPYVQFYTTRRVGGDVVNFEAIKLIKFAA